MNKLLYIGLMSLISLSIMSAGKTLRRSKSASTLAELTLVQEKDKMRELSKGLRTSTGSQLLKTGSHEITNLSLLGPISGAVIGLIIASKYTNEYDSRPIDGDFMGLGSLVRGLGDLGKSIEDFVILSTGAVIGGGVGLTSQAIVARLHKR